MEKKLFLKTQKCHLRIGHLSGICILSLLAAFIIFGCSKKEANLQEDLVVENDITFRDGRLIFKDYTTFINHQSWLFDNQFNPQLIVDKNKSFGLKSMTEYFLEGMKLDEMDPLFTAYVAKYPNVFHKEAYDSSTLYFLPHSTTLCYVANKDGIYQIGDQINRIADRCIYQINDESQIEMLFLSKDQILENGIKVIPSTSGAKGDYAQRTISFPGNSSFRMVSSLLTNYDGYYSETWELWTNPQHRVFGIWGRAQLDTKSAKGDGVYAYLSGEYLGFGPGYYTENTGISKLLTFQTFNGKQIDKDITYAPGYSRARLNSQYIYTYWDDIFNFTPTVSHPSWTPATEPF